MKLSIRMTIMTLSLLTAVSSYANPRAGTAGNRAGNTDTRVQQDTRTQDNARRGGVGSGAAAEGTAQGVIGNAARLRNEAARARQDAQRAEQASRQSAVGNAGANATASTVAQPAQANAGESSEVDQVANQVRAKVTEAASAEATEKLVDLAKNGATPEIRARALARLRQGLTCSVVCNFGGIDIAKLKTCE